MAKVKEKLIFETKKMDDVAQHKLTKIKNFMSKRSMITTCQEGEMKEGTSQGFGRLGESSCFQSRHSTTR